MSVTKASVWGEGYIQFVEKFGRGGIRYGFSSTSNKFIDVTVPSGQSVRFVMSYIGRQWEPPLFPLGGLLGGIAPIPTVMDQTQLSYTAIDDAHKGIKLEALSDNLVRVEPPELGQVEFVDRTTGEHYNPTRWKITLANGTSYVFDEAAGELERIEDRFGNAIDFEANQMTHSSGKSVQLERDSLDRVTKVIDQENNAITYEYDFYGDLVTVTDPEGNASRLTYDDEHRLLEVFDALGRRGARNEYDDDGRLIRVISADGNVVDMNRDIDGRSETILDAFGNPTVYVYDDRGNVVSTVDAEGGVVRSTYGFDDRLTEETIVLADGTELTTSYAYDVGGRLLQVVNPAGEVTKATYDSSGQVMTRTNALGLVPKPTPMTRREPVRPLPTLSVARRNIPTVDPGCFSRLYHRVVPEPSWGTTYLATTRDSSTTTIILLLSTITSTATKQHRLTSGLIPKIPTIAKRFLTRASMIREVGLSSR